VSRFQFVADHAATYEVKRLCELLEVQRSSYSAWLQAAPTRAERAAADASNCQDLWIGGLRGVSVGA